MAPSHQHPQVGTEPSVAQLWAGFLQPLELCQPCSLSGAALTWNLLPHGSAALGKELGLTDAGVTSCTPAEPQNPPAQGHMTMSQGAGDVIWDLGGKAGPRTQPAPPALLAAPCNPLKAAQSPGRFRVGGSMHIWSPQWIRAGAGRCRDRDCRNPTIHGWAVELHRHLLPSLPAGSHCLFHHFMGEMLFFPCSDPQNLPHLPVGCTH